MGRADDAALIEPRKPLRMKRDVYVYFDNDAKVRAPFDARTLRDKLFGAIARSNEDGHHSRNKSLREGPP